MWPRLTCACVCVCATTCKAREAPSTQHTQTTRTRQSNARQTRTSKDTHEHEHTTGNPGWVPPLRGCKPKASPTKQQTKEAYGPTRRFAHECNYTSLRPAGQRPNRPAHPSNQGPTKSNSAHKATTGHLGISRATLNKSPIIYIYCTRDTHGKVKS